MHAVAKRYSVGNGGLCENPTRVKLLIHCLPCVHRNGGSHASLLQTLPRVSGRCLVDRWVYPSNKGTARSAELCAGPGDRRSRWQRARRAAAPNVDDGDGPGLVGKRLQRKPGVGPLLRWDFAFSTASREPADRFPASFGSVPESYFRAAR